MAKDARVVAGNTFKSTREVALDAALRLPIATLELDGAGVGQEVVNAARIIENFLDGEPGEAMPQYITINISGEIGENPNELAERIAHILSFRLKHKVKDD